jgi:hypothetical protein
MHSGMSTPTAATDTASYPHLTGQPAAAARWWFMLEDGNVAAPPNTAGQNTVKLIGGTADEDQWEHVAVTKTAAGVFTLYENGVAVHTVDAAAIPITFDGIAGSTKHIGVHGDPANPGGNRFWTGLMDDLANLRHGAIGTTDPGHHDERSSRTVERSIVRHGNARIAHAAPTIRRAFTLASL